MAVRRIVANLAAAEPAAAHRFYGEVLGLVPAMDMGWIVTFAADAPVRPQLSVASGGGAGMPVPALSIEVDDVDAVAERCRAAGFPPDYGPVDEPWGVRRFLVRDPSGALVNILAHR
jgi:catechol 2,3-dioxygenase-like lactoylglutathione lyase family enzyme